MTIPRRQKKKVEAMLWVAANRGVITRIAAECGYKGTSMVSHVLYGRRKNECIEKALRDAGAPGF